MSFFQKILGFFLAPLKRKKKQEEWASRFGGTPAKPDNLIPLDPNDPWKT